MAIWGAMALPVMSQVKGISYTLSPTGEYVFWDETTGIKDGYLAGGQLGFGFGEYVELRASYMQSLNLKRDFSALSPAELRSANWDPMDVEVQRWGGDVKVNLGRGGIVPYLTAGTGVQTIEPKNLSRYKNIYFSAGGGLQFSVADRYTLGVQAINTSFNDSPVRSLTSAAERSDKALMLDDYPNELLQNWSVRASMQFYLGGRRPGELSKTEKAYLNNFSSGVSLPIEVTGGQLNFGDNLPYADTKFIGVSSGLNFGPYVGIRGFYWRGMQEGYFSEIDRLALYGGEGKFKLSNGQGLTPSISVGGGVIDVLKGYKVNGGKGGDVNLEDKPFASGGLGLDFPFSRSVKLSAYAKALLTANDLLEKVTDPNQLTTSWAYGLSMNVVLGNGARSVGSESEASAYDELVMNNMASEKRRSEDLRKEYEDAVSRLDERIREARNGENPKLEANLKDERATLKESMARIKEVEQKEKEANREAYDENDALLMQMTPTEYRAMIDRIERSTDRYIDNVRQSDNATGAAMAPLEKRLESIENKLDELRKENQEFREAQRNQSAAWESTRENLRQREAEFEQRMENLRNELLRANQQNRSGRTGRAGASVATDSLVNSMSEEFQAMMRGIRESNQRYQDQVEQALRRSQRDDNRNLDVLRAESDRDRAAFRRDFDQQMEAIREEIRSLRFRDESNKVGLDSPQLLPATTADINYRTPEQKEYANPYSASDGFFNLLNYEGMSVLGGFSLGGAPTLNLGFRSHYRYKDSDLFLMPETFLGLGSSSKYGLLLNALYEIPLTKAKQFNPYVGLGAGILRIGPGGEERVQLGSNIILGVNLFEVAGGRFYVDFSGRNLFRYNQLAAGYRLPF